MNIGSVTLDNVVTPSVALPGWRRRAEALAISMIGGLLLAAALRYPAAGPLLGIGWVVLALPAVIERWRAPFLGWMPGHLLAFMYAHWPMAKFGWYVGVFFTAILTWNYVVAAILARVLVRRTRLPLVLVLPLALCAGEYLRPLGVGDCNMYQSGVFLYDYPILIQAADLIGSAGLSFLWTIPFAVAADWLRLRLDGVGCRRTLLRGVAASVAVMAFLIGYGSWRLHHDDYTAGPRVAVIQPSVDHTPEATADAVRVQTQMTVEAVAPGSADLIVWPENAILLPFETHKNFQDTVAFLTRTKSAPLLFGTQATGPDGRRPTCSAFVVDTEGKTVGRYDKVVLFPFTERRVLPSLEKIWPAASDFVRQLTRRAWGSAPDGFSGSGGRTLSVPIASGPMPIWTPICYENNYPWLAREAARNGAEVFINITSEGWLGWAVSNNQMAASVLRAVESRVGMIRAGNTGPSCFILPDGRIDGFVRGKQGQLRLEPGTLIHTVVRGNGTPTIYARCGDWLDPLPLLTCVGLILASLWRQRARQ
ncbi:MAG: apolipoprotein N-acyltransferase [Acidobacteriota bacterium]